MSNEHDGEIHKYRKDNGTYYRIDTYFNGMFIVFYDNVPKKLYAQFERIMNSVKIITPQRTKNESEDDTTSNSNRKKNDYETKKDDENE